MADAILFDEGANYVLDNGTPSTSYWLLSTKKVGTGLAGEHQAGDTLAGGVGEITGTGYTRKTQASPAAAARAKAYAVMSWATGTATDWPASVRSIVLVTTSNNTGKAIYAENLQSGGTARDMSAANTTETVTPTVGL